jgi:hypothetical protein
VAASLPRLALRIDRVAAAQVEGVGPLARFRRSMNSESLLSKLSMSSIQSSSMTSGSEPKRS